jgi:hypothetical protein
MNRLSPRLRHRTCSKVIALAAVFLLGSCAPVPSPTPTTPTGIPYVDTVIAAVQSGDTQAIKALIVPSTVPCTTEKWLLRQPLCAEGEIEGTPVKTLPTLSDDLGHIRIKESNEWQGIGQGRLYAVYRTGSYTYSDEYYPAGEYAVAFLPEESEFANILQVTKEGIVRIDYCGVRLDICNGLTIEEILKENPSAFILGPIDQ